MASRKRKTSPTKSRTKRKKSAPASKLRKRPQPLQEWRLSPELSDLNKLVPPGAVDRPPIKGVVCLTKSPIFELAEAKFNSLPPEQKEQILRELLRIMRLPQEERLGAYMSLNVRFQLLRGETVQKHIRNDWMGKYFPAAAINTLVTGAIVATQRSLAAGLPVDMYWSAGPDAEMRFAVTESPYQITFLLITPPVVGRDTPTVELKRTERIWFTKTESDGSVSVVQQIATSVRR